MTHTDFIDMVRKISRGLERCNNLLRESKNNAYSMTKQTMAATRLYRKAVDEMPHVEGIPDHVKEEVRSFMKIAEEHFRLLSGKEEDNQ